jgi:hypothetical protein
VEELRNTTALRPVEYLHQTDAPYQPQHCSF